MAVERPVLARQNDGGAFVAQFTLDEGHDHSRDNRGCRAAHQQGDAGGKRQVGRNAVVRNEIPETLRLAVRGWRAEHLVRHREGECLSGGVVHQPCHPVLLGFLGTLPFPDRIEKKRCGEVHGERGKLVIRRFTPGGRFGEDGAGCHRLQYNTRVLTVSTAGPVGCGHLSVGRACHPRCRIASIVRVAIDNEFIRRIDSPRFCEQLFATLPDVVFCLKDEQQCYRAANQAFAERVGLKDPRKLIGKTAADFFPAELVEGYREQDRQVLGGGEIRDELELISDADGNSGWFLATKIPLHGDGGRIVGLASISRNLRAPRQGDAEFSEVAKVAEHIRQHLEDPLRATELAELAGMTVPQLDRRMKRVFHLSTAQFVRKSRIEHAAALLSGTSLPIAGIALDCGYGDQTAFTRQFRATVGMPPAVYRSYARKV
ncbi:MAG: AraC family transcriptional regulator [Verrucomicrobiaceae bacterium]|nr:MAG: AraC family transcriptional regulator [Verrucomicrobiaceae bacterium]